MESTASPQPLLAAMTRLEGLEAVDAVAGPGAARLRGASPEPVRAALRGDWLGHALHPLLTDFPLGCWLSAGLLDVFGGRASRPAAQRLVGLGLLTVAPTAAAGLADWTPVADARSRRVGVVHAIGNSVVALCYWQSWRA